MTSNIRYYYDPVTNHIAERLEAKCRGTIAYADHEVGLVNGEPLIIAMDALVKYAKAHRTRYHSALKQDYVLGPEWLDAIKGLRGLLNGQGGVAIHQDRGTDSKDNGALEETFWKALEIAGYEEADLN